MVSYRKHCPDFRTLVIQNEKLQIIWNLQMVPEELQYGQYINDYEILFVWPKFFNWKSTEKRSKA